MMATEAMAAAAASTTSSGGSSLGMSNGGAPTNSSGKIENKMLPSFSDILWCPDIDGDVMSNPVMGQAIVSKIVLYFLPKKVTILGELLVLYHLIYR